MKSVDESTLLLYSEEKKIAIANYGTFSSVSLDDSVKPVEAAQHGNVGESVMAGIYGMFKQVYKVSTVNSKSCGDSAGVVKPERTDEAYNKTDQGSGSI